MTPTAKRPKLRTVPLTAVLPLRAGLAYITCSPGQWDNLLSEAYGAGWVLLLTVAQRSLNFSAVRIGDDTQRFRTG